MKKIKIRDPYIAARNIKMIYPRFFYHQCKVCGYEFKNTTMWSWIDDWGPECWFRAYACTSCVPDIKDLYQHISGMKIRDENGNLQFAMPRPDPPPPPPQKGEK